MPVPFPEAALDHRNSNASTLGNSGKVMLEMAIIFPIFLLVLGLAFEVIVLVRERQLAQTVSKEAATRAYRECSGYSDTATNRTDAGVIERCLERVANTVVAAAGASVGADVHIGLFRCDPPSGGGPCVPTFVRGVGVLTTWISAMANTSHPLNALLRSQGVVIVARAHWDYQSAIGKSIGVRLVTPGEVSDVTIL